MFLFTDSNPLIHQIPAPSATFHGGNNQILLPEFPDHHHRYDHQRQISCETNNIRNNVLRGDKGGGRVKPPRNHQMVFPSRTVKKKAVIKNDRHTKIMTAQGLRDRRVRLSISIARKFFDLQDTLGFDKPSKTLNWLFAKSRLAIQEVIRAKEESDGEPLEMGKRAKHFPIKDESATTVGIINCSDVAKDSRAKARARARARTIKKMCIKEVMSEGKMLLPAAAAAAEPVPQLPLIKSLFDNKSEVVKSNKESVVIEKKMIRLGSMWDIPQHLRMPKDLGSLNNNNNNPENWNYAASTTILSSQSQVHQICTKSWEWSDHNYQC